MARARCLVLQFWSCLHVERLVVHSAKHEWSPAAVFGTMTKTSRIRLLRSPDVSDADVELIS